MSDDAVKLVEKINASMEALKSDNEKINAELKKAVGSTDADAKAAVKAAEELAKKVQAHTESIVELEQKLAEGVIKGKAPIETLGQMVIKSEQFKQFANGNISRARIEANTITGQDGSPPENSNILVPADRRPGIVPLAYRSLRVRDVIPNVPTTSNSVEVTREATNTMNAAETEEAATKPESAITYELVATPIRTVAHWLKVSKQALDDAPMLQAHIDGRLRHGAENRYDFQLLRGNGTGQNMSGILASGNHTVFTPTSGENQLDSVNRGIEAVGVADYSATAIIMHTSDWHAIERLKVGSSDDRYIIGSPQGMIIPMLWGLPVVVTNNMLQGYFITSAFNISHTVFNRSGVVVEMFEQDDTNVQQNLVTVRAELRGALGTNRPESCRAGLLVFGSSS